MTRLRKQTILDYLNEVKNAHQRMAEPIQIIKGRLKKDGDFYKEMETVERLLNGQDVMLSTLSPEKRSKRKTISNLELLSSALLTQNLKMRRIIKGIEESIAPTTIGGTHVDHPPILANIYILTGLLTAQEMILVEILR